MTDGLSCDCSQGSSDRQTFTLRDQCQMPGEFWTDFLLEFDSHLSCGDSQRIQFGGPGSCISEWVSGWVNGWVSKCMSVWVNGWASVSPARMWVSVRVWVSECVSVSFPEVWCGREWHFFNPLDTEDYVDNKTSFTLQPLVRTLWRKRCWNVTDGIQT